MLIEIHNNPCSKSCCNYKIYLSCKGVLKFCKIKRFVLQTLGYRLATLNMDYELLIVFSCNTIYCVCMLISLGHIMFVSHMWLTTNDIFHRLQPSRNFLTVKNFTAMSRVKDCLSRAPLFVKEVVMCIVA